VAKSRFCTYQTSSAVLNSLKLLTNGHAAVRKQSVAIVQT